MNFFNYKYFHWLYFTKQKKLLFSIVLSVFFWLFLSIAQPFGISSEGINGFLMLSLWLIPMGIVWVVSIFFGDVLVDAITKKKNRINYKIDRYGWILKLFLIVHFIWLFRSYSCNWKCFDFLEYAELWFGCILMFLFIYIPFSIYAKLEYYKAAFTHTDTVLKKHEIELNTDGKQRITLDAKNVVYFKSDDNYIDAYTTKEEELISKTFRATMKSLEATLQSYPQFVRVHRSFIINLNYCVPFKPSSNKNQITLKYNGTEVSIPVSRKYKKNLLSVLS